MTDPRTTHKSPRAPKRPGDRSAVIPLANTSSGKGQSKPGPALSVVLLTLNEEANIQACLQTLARQSSRDFEVIVVDADSHDRTVEIVRAQQATFPVPLRIEAATRQLDIGEARNLGVALARSENVAFLSADLDVDGRWVDEAIRSLETHDLVFGRQIHAPRTWNIGSAVRGLRYHFPLGQSPDPLRYASNVGAAYKKAILQRFPFDPWANAAEDLLLARHAAQSGANVLYNAHMIVRHHDVADARSEWRKNAREGQGWGFYAHDLGLLIPVLAWGFALLAGLFLLAVPPDIITLSTLARFAPLPAILWLPSLRRSLRLHAGMPARQWLLGLLASPAFDLAFLFHYVRALLTGRSTPNARHTSINKE